MVHADTVGMLMESTQNKNAFQDGLLTKKTFQKYLYMKMKMKMKKTQGKVWVVLQTAIATGELNLWPVQQKVFVYMTVK